MMTLIPIEWLRFSRNPLNLWVLALFFVLMTVSATWSGLVAREYRHTEATPVKIHVGVNQAEMHDAPKAHEPTEKSSAYALGSKAQALNMPALGGLALNVSQVDFLSTTINASIRNRHTDGRTSDPLFNPLMHELGFLDFSTLLALFTPLLIIALSYGLIQEDRESGVWRLVCTQSTKPWMLVFTALAVRFGLVLMLMFISSGITFAIDSGSSLAALAQWLIFISCYALLWFAIAGLALLLRISSGAAALVMLGVWLILTFAVPAGLSFAANQHSTMPSRLTAIIDIRHFQELSNQQRQSLLSKWYSDHPEITPPSTELAREISSLPAGLELDSQIRPLMVSFDAARKSQFEFMERWSALSPALAMVLMADRLAGLDAPRYADFIAQVNHFEDQWRARFVPSIMANSPWSANESAPLPSFAFNAQQDNAACWRLSGIQALIALAFLGLLFALRRQFAKS